MDQIILTPAKHTQLLNGLATFGFSQDQIDHIMGSARIEIVNESHLAELGFTPEIITLIMNGLT